MFLFLYNIPLCIRGNYSTTKLNVILEIIKSPSDWKQVFTSVIIIKNNIFAHDSYGPLQHEYFNLNNNFEFYSLLYHYTFIIIHLMAYNSQNYHFLVELIFNINEKIPEIFRFFFFFSGNCPFIQILLVGTN